MFENPDQLEAFNKLKAEKKAEGKEVWVQMGSSFCFYYLHLLLSTSSSIFYFYFLINKQKNCIMKRR